jgi:hypothetical protein
MTREAKAIDFWTLIAVLVLGTIFGTCVLSAFGMKTVAGGVSRSQVQDSPGKAIRR